MAQIIGLPKLSPTMEEGVLVKWIKAEGDAVEPGDLVAEVETDKANMDFNLEDEGVLLKLLVAEGDTVKLGAPVAILGEAGEDITALLAGAEAPLAGGAPPSAPAAAPAPAAATTRATAPPSQAPAAGHAPGAVTSKPGQPVLASPLAKTLAIELGIDLRTLGGSGPGGRIVERDVRAAVSGSHSPTSALAGERTAPAVTADPGPAAPSTALAVISGVPSSTPAVIPASADYVDKPLSSMRKRIAERMAEVKRTVPHFYLTRDFDVGPLLGFRHRLNTLLGDRGKVSVTDMLIKGVALALRRVPDCNAAFAGDAIRYYTGVHIGVAVAIEDGLVTPVIRNADLKGIGVIAGEVKDLATRARERRLKMHEIQGSTFTVSNLGMFGIDHFEAIINPPEAGILAIGTITEKPVVVDGQVGIGKRMNLSMSCDHRVIDGALGARYLKELVDILEKPESLAL